MPSLPSPIVLDTAYSPETLRQVLPGAGDPLLFKQNGKVARADTPELSITSWAVQPGDTVWGLLEGNGFVPNADLIGVVKALNSNVSDLDQLAPGEVLQLPHVKAMGDDRYILVDKSLRRGLEPLHFDTVGSGLSDPTIKALGKASAAVQEISTISTSLPGDFVDLARRQAEAVPILMGEDYFVSSGGGDVQFPPGLDLALFGLENAGEIVRKNGRTHRALIVHTLSAESDEPLCGLSVYYVSEFDFFSQNIERYKRRLASFSSPAQGQALAAQIRVWGEWQGTVVSSREAVDLTRRDVEFELHVLQGRNCP